MAEAADLEVNWAEFAYKQTHPHQSHSAEPRILPAFEDLDAPLPPLTKVVPLLGSKVLEKRILNLASNSEAVEAVEVTPGSTPVANADDVQHPPPTVESSANLYVDVKIGSALPGSSSLIQSPINPFRQGFPPLLAADVSGLSVVRPAVLEILDSKIMKLRESRHDGFNVVAIAQRRLDEEMERLDFVTRKVHEKNESYEKASAEHNRARDMLALAIIDESNVNSADRKQSTRIFSTRICESLVQSWADNAMIADQSRGAWDFKFRRQSALVAKMQTDMTATRVTYRGSCTVIDAEIAHLHATIEFLNSLE
ncbi:hypothetical protein M758_UG036200 [Ceratodon purpureus]|nr:hypothetical protein M758_UG036200 [Ceratodon purpureus]